MCGLPSLKLTAKAPENGWLEDYFPFGMASWRCYVSFRECIPQTLVKSKNKTPNSIGCESYQPVSCVGCMYIMDLFAKMRRVGVFLLFSR